MIDRELLKKQKHRSGMSVILIERATGISVHKIMGFLNGVDELLTEEEYNSILAACSTFTVFDKVYENCKWKKKYRGKKPEGEVMYRWHIDNKADMSQARAKTTALKEESLKFSRAFYLEDLADGQVITIVQKRWD